MAGRSGGGPVAAGAAGRELSTLPVPPSMLERLQHHGFDTQADVLAMTPVELAKGARAAVRARRRLAPAARTRPELSVSPAEALAILKCVTNNTPPDAGACVSPCVCVPPRRLHTGCCRLLRCLQWWRPA